jgi:AcrR family transcriptional regulator
VHIQYVLLAEREKQDTRDLIIDAADRLMARLGFRKMTMDDVAREAGVSKRTIYLHFASKEEVGLSSIGRVVERAQACIVEIAAEPGDPSDRLERMLSERVMARVLAVQDYHQGLDEIFEAVRPAYMARRQQYFAHECEIIAEVLEEGRASGRFMLDNPAETAQDLLLATNAFLPYSLSVKELGQPTQIRSRLERMVSLLVRGLVIAETPPWQPTYLPPLQY